MTDLLVPPAPAPAPEPAPGRAPAGGRGTWRLGEAALLRAAGQPVSRAESLSFPRTAAWVAQVLALREGREATADLARDALTAAVAACPAEHPDRVGLINLRRDVFNGRRPRPATQARAMPLLDEAARAVVDRWMRAVAACEELTQLGPAVLEDETAVFRQSARRVLDHDDFRGAVLLQSTVLERSMDRYLDPARKVDKHARQVERGLLELFSRAAYKTSPFSTLTSVGMVRLTEAAAGGRGSTYPSPRTLGPRTRATLNVAVAARLSSAVSARPDLRSGLTVSVAPGIRTEDDLVRYVRRRTTASADADAVVTVDAVHESLFYLPSGRVMADITDHLASQPSCTVGELVAHVRSAAPHEPRDAHQVERLVGHLLRLGYLLLPELQMDLHSPHPCRVLASRLAEVDDPVLRELAAGLSATLDLVDRYTGTPARERRALLDRVRSQLTEVYALAGAAEDLLPRTLVYEDAFIDDPDLGVDAAAWRAAYLPALSALADVLPAFDLNLPRRLTTVGFFRARYGAGGVCDDLERFCHEYQRDFFEPYTQRLMRRAAFDEDNVYQPQENWFDVERIEALDAARRRAALHLDSRYREAPEAEEIALGTAFVQEVTDLLGNGGGLRSPWSFFLQVAPAHGAVPATPVLNQAYAGMTTMFSRFVHGLEETGPGSADLLRRVLLDSVPADTVLAELGGGFETSNLNVHPWLTTHELVCPGDVSARPAEAQIPLSELRVVHDRDTDTLHLWSERLQRRVVPVYLGFLMPMALPEIQQVLLCFSPAGMAPVDLWAGTGTPVAADRVSAYPRITLHGLVLQRRMWKLDRTLFPAREAGEHPAAYLLRVQVWRREHGLPQRLFAHVDADGVTARAADDGGDGDAGPDNERRSTRKPLAVDLDNWASVQLLEQLVLAARSRITFKEALPDVDQLSLVDGQGERHVSELLVEIYPEEKA